MGGGEVGLEVQTCLVAGRVWVGSGWAELEGGDLGDAEEWVVVEGGREGG